MYNSCWFPKTDFNCFAYNSYPSEVFFALLKILPIATSSLGAKSNTSLNFTISSFYWGTVGSYAADTTCKQTKYLAVL